MQILDQSIGNMQFTLGIGLSIIRSMQRTLPCVLMTHHEVYAAPPRTRLVPTEIRAELQDVGLASARRHDVETHPQRHPEHIDTGTTVENVVSTPSHQDIITVAAKQAIVPTATAQRIVPTHATQSVGARAAPELVSLTPTDRHRAALRSVDEMQWL